MLEILNRLVLVSDDIQVKIQQSASWIFLDNLFSVVSPWYIIEKTAVVNVAQNVFDDAI